MISFESSGSFDNTEAFLKKMQEQQLFNTLESHAKQGVDALRNATPTETGLAAMSWGYEIKKSRSGFEIIWTNSDVESGFPVAIMLQYGYATGTGGYVQGRDYINPAMKPIFDRILEDVWKAVTSA